MDFTAGLTVLGLVLLFVMPAVCGSPMLRSWTATRIIRRHR